MPGMESENTDSEKTSEAFLPDSEVLKTVLTGNSKERIKAYASIIR